MKRLMIALGVIAVCASVNAQTNQVLSRNAVGYEKVSVRTNQLVMARLDFVNLSGAPFTVTNLIGDQLPQGSAVLLWDRATPGYIAEQKQKSGWTPGTNRITRGSGFFIRGATTAASNEYQVFMMGEVPDATTAPTTTVANITGLAMYGYPYPADIAYTNVAIVKNASSGDSVLTWDVPTQNYIGYQRTKSGWQGDITNNLILRPGQGFWFRSAVTQQWSEVKPYTWP